MTPSDQHAKNTPNRYVVIPRVLIFPQYQDQVLLLKGAPTKRLWPNMYNGIGGHMEPGETVKQTAVRELEEESGISSVDLHLCGMVSINLSGPKPDIMLFVYTCHVASPETRHSAEGTLEWFAWSAPPAENLMPDLPELLPRVQQFAHTRQPFYAIYTYNAAGSLEITFTN